MSSEFANLLKKVRRKAGFTQKQLGEKLGVGPIAVSHYERNTGHLPSRNKITEILNALGVDDPAVRAQFYLAAGRGCWEDYKFLRNWEVNPLHPLDEIYDRIVEVSRIMDIDSDEYIDILKDALEPVHRIAIAFRNARKPHA